MAALRMDPVNPAANLEKNERILKTHIGNILGIRIFGNLPYAKLKQTNQRWPVGMRPCAAAEAAPQASMDQEYEVAYGLRPGSIPR